MKFSSVFRSAGASFAPLFVTLSGTFMNTASKQWKKNSDMSPAGGVPSLSRPNGFRAAALFVRATFMSRSIFVFQSKRCRPTGLNGDMDSRPS